MMVCVSLSEIGCDVMMMVRCSLSEIGCDVMMMVCCSVSEIGCDGALLIERGWLKSPPKMGLSLCEAGHPPVCSMPQLTMSTPQSFLNTPPHSVGSPPRRSPLKSGAETRWLGEELDIFQVPELSLSGFGQSLGKKSCLGENGSSVDLHPHGLSLSQFLQSPAKRAPAMEGAGVAMPTLSAPSTSMASSSFIPAPPSLFGEGSQDSLVARLDMDTALQSVMMESSIDYSTKFEKLAEHLIDNTDASQPSM
ncbi:hypothetical protein ACOMHN_047611 [Nucella lapillus]